ncbi:hypothetical protein BJ875DRAFT_442770 [Amylocarpus encephaloides]|uniref:Uncharacterized protein n=1 Tax=Amylocarpus encephaloides TaxID=45428 RepID=A0A9P8C3V0_9HELO|nr:hypothetical protein BJ875DRAFT_442770 [Amylocarpus encephaloides]
MTLVTTATKRTSPDAHTARREHRASWSGDPSSWSGSCSRSWQAHGHRHAHPRAHAHAHAHGLPKLDDRRYFEGAGEDRRDFVGLGGSMPRDEHVMSLRRASSRAGQGGSQKETGTEGTPDRIPVGPATQRVLNSSMRETTTTDSKGERATRAVCFGEKTCHHGRRQSSLVDAEKSGVMVKPPMRAVDSLGVAPLRGFPALRADPPDGMTYGSGTPTQSRRELREADDIGRDSEGALGERLRSREKTPPESSEFEGWEVEPSRRVLIILVRSTDRMLTSDGVVTTVTCRRIEFPASYTSETLMDSSQARSPIGTWSPLVGGREPKSVQLNPTVAPYTTCKLPLATRQIEPCHRADRILPTEAAGGRSQTHRLTDSETRLRDQARSPDLSPSQGLSPYQHHVRERPNGILISKFLTEPRPTIRTSMCVLQRR